MRFFCSAQNKKDHIPNLAVFDQINSWTGIIRSYRHGDSPELLHVRILVQDIEMMYPEALGGLQRHRIMYSRKDSSLRKSFMPWFHRCSKPIWQNFARYQNEVIPMGLFQRMREVDKVEDDEKWDQRQVEVSEEAWDLLLDYCKVMEDVSDDCCLT